MVFGLPDPARSRAVLIGVGQYEMLDDLPAVHNNVHALAEILTSPDSWALPAENCTLVTQPTTAPQIMDAIAEAVAHATDALLVYYAGHGLMDAAHSVELYLATSDSSRQRIYAALPYEHVRRRIQTASARRKVVILDCCYSGRALHGAMAQRHHIADQTMATGAAVLTATAETALALAPRGKEFTAFTGELIRSLRTGIPSAQQILDLATVHDHLRGVLAKQGYPEPQMSNRNAGGAIAIARNLAFRLDEPPPNAKHEPPRPVRSKRRRSVLAVAAAAMLLATGGLTWANRPGDRSLAPVPGSTDPAANLPTTATVPVGLTGRLAEAYDAQLYRDRLITAVANGRTITVTAAEAASGKQLWRVGHSWKQAIKDAPIALTLTVDSDVVAVTLGQSVQEPQSELLALDPTTGGQLWRKIGAVAYLPLAGSRALVQHAYGKGPSRQIIDRRTGRTVWTPQGAISTLVAGEETTAAPFSLAAVAAASAPGPFTGQVDTRDTGASRLLELDRDVRVRDVKNGRVLNRTNSPLRLPNMDWTILAAKGSWVQIRTPEDVTGPMVNAAITNYDSATGRKRWKIELPFENGPTATPPEVFPCTRDAICVAQRIGMDRLRISLYDITTGRLNWSTEAADILTGMQLAYAGPGYRDKSVLLVTVRSTDLQDVLVLDATTGRVRRSDHNIFAVPADDRLVLLRGQLDGPGVGPVNVAVLSLINGAYTELGTIPTAARFCRASPVNLACPDQDGKIQIRTFNNALIESASPIAYVGGRRGER